VADVEFKSGWVTAAWFIAVLQAVVICLIILSEYRPPGPGRDEFTDWLFYLVDVVLLLVCGLGVFLRRTGFALALLLFQGLGVASILYGLFTGGDTVLRTMLSLAGLVVFFKAYRALKMSKATERDPTADIPQQERTE
jgi:hypothetical protein